MDNQIDTWTRNQRPSFLEDLEVSTELVTFQNVRGLRVVGFHDYSARAMHPGKWMMVLPGYGETKTDVLTESFFLAKNGFHTLRFDYTDHVGESDGDIRDTSVAKLKDDIIAGVDYIIRRFQPAKLGAIGRSLASRALIRAAREDNRIALLLNLVSIVDVRKTLFAIYQQDHFDRLHRGIPNGIMDVLGFQVDADNFIRSAIDDGYENLDTTLDDAGHIHAPVVFFAAERDVWVELDDVRRVVDFVGSNCKVLHVLKNAMHEVHENPHVARELLEKVIYYCLRYFGEHEKASSIMKPNLREIGSRIRKEKERNRIIHGVSKEEEREFWKNYLDKYSFVINVHDYWNLLELIYRVLGEPKNGDRILDAGCGIGNFGTFLLLKSMYKVRNSSLIDLDDARYLYIGADFVKEATLKAADSQRAIEMEFCRFVSENQKENGFVRAYCVVDLDCEVPFKDAVFNKICSNLVVSYLRDPAKAVLEMIRVLKPNGKIVIASLKPFPDLSEVYRNFLRVTGSEQAIQEAQKLLMNAGQIKLKEAQGLYQFFSEDNLSALLKESGICEIETFRAFGNQANVATGIKP